MTAIPRETPIREIGRVLQSYIRIAAAPFTAALATDATKTGCFTKAEANASGDSRFMMARHAAPGTFGVCWIVMKVPPKSGA